MAESSLWADDPPGWSGVVLAGHTHLPFQRTCGVKTVVNPGSVGQPKHGRAETCYAIWQDGKIALGAVAYDADRTIEKLWRLSLPTDVLEDLSFVLRNGRVPPPAADSSS